MKEIKCPKCGEVFAVDESGYAQIVQQIRDKEFDKELKQREKNIEEIKKKDLELVKIQQKDEFDKLIASKDSELTEKDKIIEQLKSQVIGNETEKQLAISEAINKKEQEREVAVGKKNDELADKNRKIAELEAQIENGENEKKLAITEAVNAKEKEINTLKESFFAKDLEKDKQIEQLKAHIKESETEKQLAVNEAINKKDRENQSELIQKNQMIDELKAKLVNSEMEKKLEVSEAVQKKEKEISEKLTEITELKSQLSSKDTENQLKEQSLHKEYGEKLKLKDEQIEYYKDFKARQSTKMIGESLEQHCLNQFNTLRMTAFPKAYFEKDNDIKTGSKGDFIFKEEVDGTEFISIMFEMKNEMDETATKHKNEDFFKELDRDRREKGCEYAVLVSLLEIDNELYNNGIVDVSYKYEKMYVIRPQFFIPMITLLRNAALNSLKYRQELELARHQQIDILHFEENMNTFKDSFARNYRIASDKFKTAIDEIDKTISHLQKTKEGLLSSENQLRLANNKAEDLSIKKLTKDAPSVKKMFDEINRDENI